MNAGPRTAVSWVSQLDLSPLMQDMLDLDYEDEAEGSSELLVSDDKEDGILILQLSCTAAHQLLTFQAWTCRPCANALRSGLTFPGWQ